MKTRREFLKSTVLGASATWTVPLFIERTFADLHAGAKDLAVQAVTGKDDTILVVLQLAGGNDGLNTVVPYLDDAYHKARPRLAKKEKDLIRLDDGVGLNSSMPFLGDLYGDGGLAVVRGVGYPNPNRSHFVSTSVWETGDPNVKSNTGWLGRYFDNACSGSDPTIGISLNKTQPEAFGAMKNPGVCLSTPELYRWIHGGGEQAEAERFFESLNAPDDAVDGASIAEPAVGRVGSIVGESNLEFLERVAMDARVSSKKILEVAAKHRTKVRYDGTPVSRSLNMVARMIAGKMPTRVYYVSHGGFDTHNGQINSHDRLLGQLDGALKSFFQDLREQGNADRVTVMTFSEFGRRVAENASSGTDHGKASCLFVAGAGVKGGLYGTQPSLTDLSQGDLKHSVDFRQVYATLLEGWLRTDPEAVLRGRYGKLGFMG
ncbi:MAG: DUF1501 domain-containing protein [Akkermansiaceae bacterium]|jgi:uncharacterized protein (DUF1501 family)|nr:DUF1501 domain-containing protein [Akkermansiaceae bacterium]